MPQTFTRNPLVVRQGRRLWRTAATAVEFAVTLPVLMLLVIGGMEFTRYGMVRQHVNHAAYTAARAAIIPGADAATAVAAARQHLAAIGLKASDITVRPQQISEATHTVEITITVPFAENSWLTPEFLSGNVRGHCRLATERAPMMQATNLPAPPPPPKTASEPKSEPKPKPKPSPSPAPKPAPKPKPAAPML